MGTSKAWLEWHGSTLVRRAAGLLLRGTGGPVVIVRAAGQALPPLPADCEVVEDARSDRGPLEALAAGLGALTGRAEAAFVTATDAPLLHPDFVAAVLDGLGAGAQICVPSVAGVDHPLAAAYRLSVAPTVAGLLAADRLRLGLLLDGCRVRRLTAAELLAGGSLARSDARLESLLNLNRAGDYAAARRRPAPAISLRGPESARARPARAATLAGAAAAAGVAFPGDGSIAASVNGRPAGVDPELPLVTGDFVAFGPGRLRGEGDPPSRAGGASGRGRN
jgi:molybdopterin-guanine dinucleotide biosynthesis protein A